MSKAKSGNIMVIESGSTVSMHFDIRLKDGSIAESTRSFEQPMTFTLGQEVFSEKLENEMLGLKVGDKKKIMLLPEDAFGEPHPANIYQVSRSQFAKMEAETPLEEGLIVAFVQQNGDELPGIIREIAEDEVTVDFNHPLSGQVVLFDIEIVDVKA
ncbi:MAG: FKBP-type peptidyl-prolyl cis-trans isomerase family protein [Gammaproteobacteria bacterium]|jgi:FKBP-type peptidyl-prolyl cis-trans isomerase SlpA|nr:FKBP-type peptidyl-prolyl cis-trans isomerase family protein [Gammaproteobacteria bacterium]